MIERQTDFAIKIFVLLALMTVRQIGVERERQQKREQNRQLATLVQYIS
ncbi:MAG: hypothetical protein OXQ89_01785 [Rhodospirillaceae bacterium]|nr:hypothetical protein [Rhodospirillaceae bacterium]